MFMGTKLVLATISDAPRSAADCEQQEGAVIMTPGLPVQVKVCGGYIIVFTYADFEVRTHKTNSKTSERPRFSGVNFPGVVN